MTIEELLAATGLTANDLVPIYDAEAAQSVEPTQKITAAQFAAAVKVLADLQGKLTFDSTPTTGSTNPVTSGGVANAIAQSTATKISDIIISETVQTFTTTAQIDANGGAPLVNIGGTAIVPNVPAGYTFVGNVNITINGGSCIFISFDGSTQHTSRSVTPYVTNASSQAFPANRTLTVRLFSLCIKK